MGGKPVEPHSSSVFGSCRMMDASKRHVLDSTCRHDFMKQRHSFPKQQTALDQSGMLSETRLRFFEFLWGKEAPALLCSTLPPPPLLHSNRDPSKAFSSTGFFLHIHLLDSLNNPTHNTIIMSAVADADVSDPLDLAVLDATTAHKTHEKQPEASWTTLANASSPIA